MTLDQFVANPWASSSIHNAYRESFLHMRPAPEFASGEVVLASLYRNVGFSEISEGKVPANGRAFLKLLEKKKRPGDQISATGIDDDTWIKIVTKSITSPKQPNQSSKRFLQLCPVVPDTVLYSLSARLSSNSWNPGSLIARILCMGEESEQRALAVWQQLFDSLSIKETDDVWARLLQQEFESWRTVDAENYWEMPGRIDSKMICPDLGSNCFDFPAQRFSADLKHVLKLKEMLTRRQWVSLLESLLRVGSAAHIMWICKINGECVKLFEKVLGGGDIPSVDEVSSRLSINSGYWCLGQPSSNTIKELAREFLYGRAGINLILLRCMNIDTERMPSQPLINPASIVEFTEYLASIRNKFSMDCYKGNLSDTMENDPRVPSCKRGISSNIVEFLGHVLRQRQTSEPGMESYDQGYYLKKRGAYKQAPWVVGLGPVAILTMVHCCTSSVKGPRTVEDLCLHLEKYGFEIKAQDVPSSEFGKSLRGLGLVIDSPDAEGGMVLVNPLHRSNIGDGK